MTVFGWDASDFDWPRGPMDLAAARTAGIDFFTHKATEGTKTKHKGYGEALRRARDAGVPVLGAYGIPRSNQGTDAQQVDYFLAYVDQQTPWWRDWPHWMFQVDLEHWSYDKVGPAHGVAWCQRLRALTGRRVVLYAPKWAYGDTIGGSDPLWASAYGSNPAGNFKAVYPGDGSSRWGTYSGRVPTVLQYGSRTIIGRQPTCDANAFRGSLADLLAFVGGPTSATTSGDDDMTPEQDRMLYNLDRLNTALLTGADTVTKLRLQDGTYTDMPLQVVRDVNDLKDRPAATVELSADAVAALGPVVEQAVARALERIRVEVPPAV